MSENPEVFSPVSFVSVVSVSESTRPRAPARGQRAVRGAFAGVSQGGGIRLLVRDCGRALATRTTAGASTMSETTSIGRGDADTPPALAPEEATPDAR